MRSLWLLVVGSLLIVTASVSYRVGQREMLEFDAECSTPGVRCVMVLSPEYLEAAPRITVPTHVAPLCCYESALHPRSWEQ